MHPSNIFSLHSRHLLFYMLGLTLLFSSCRQEDEINGCPFWNYIPGRTWMTVTASQELVLEQDTIMGADTVYTFFVVPGYKLYAEYSWSSDECTNNTDDGVTKQVGFEINPAVSFFDISDAGLKDIDFYYAQYAFFQTGVFPVSNGRVTGVKVNDTEWYITIDITPDAVNAWFTPQPFVVSGTFTVL